MCALEYKMGIYPRLADVPSGGFVVAEEISESGARRYIHSESADEFFSGHQPGGYYHEVLRYPCRLLLDIDEGGASEVEIRLSVDEAIRRTGQQDGENPAECGRIIVMRNSQQPDRVHVVVHLRSVVIGQEMLVVSPVLAMELARGIPGADMGIYRRNATLRMPMCRKFGRDDMYQIPESFGILDCIGYHDWAGDSTRLYGTYREIEERPRPMRSLFAYDGFMTWLFSRVEGVEPQWIRGDRWNLRRVAPGYCPMCKRSHDNIDLVAERAKDGKVWLKCPRYVVERRGNEGPRAFLLGFYRGV
jgi:hypothetical protein